MGGLKRMTVKNIESSREVRNAIRMLCLASVFAILFFATPALVSAQTTEQQQAVSDRKVISRVEPEYPETLKRLYIGGVVRVQVVVQPSGEVASTELVGGSPILGQSAMKAIKQWKYAKASAPETLIVRLEFDPHR